MKSQQHAPTIRTAFFRFYAELNDFLSEKQHKTTFPYEFTGKPSIKDIIEAIGVPHTEIDLILVDGDSVSFDYPMLGGEHITVYPVFELFDITPLVHLRSKPLRETKFVVDANLGKLATKLRLLGFDALYRNDFIDDEIVALSLQDKRIILTRDKAILKTSAITHGYWVRNDNPKKQLREVVSRLQLESDFKPFTRCSNCNERLQPIDKSRLQDCLPNDTLSIFDDFMECTGCKKIYWRGSHYHRIREWVDELEAN